MARSMAGTGASTSAGTAAMERVEIVTRAERRRNYTPEEKARLLAETAQAGARVLEVAQRHGVSPSLLHRWRRRAEGRPARKAARQVPRLVPLLVGPPAEDATAGLPEARSGGIGAAIEVVLRNGRVLRVGAAADVTMVARLAAMLEA
jgi:transposase